MPFVTEEIWGIINKNQENDTTKLLMVEKWPE